MPYLERLKWGTMISYLQRVKKAKEKRAKFVIQQHFFCESANMTEVWKCAWIVMITGEGEWFFPKNKPEKKICVFVQLRYFFLPFLST